MKVDLFLDSGAFSCWQQGNDIDLYEYIEWIREHGSIFTPITSLDVIPGQKGRTITATQADYAMRKSLDNWEAMRTAGIESIAVYHYGEPLSWLNEILERKPEYLGLGGNANVKSSLRRIWLDEVFSVLCGEAGYPEVKVHGFGVTAPDLLHRYPWWSVDSLSWVWGTAYGQFCMPPSNELGYVLDSSPVLVGVGRARPSKRKRKTLFDEDLVSSANSANATYHIDSMGSTRRAVIDEYLHTEGLELEGIRDDYDCRLRANLRYYKLVRDAWKPKPFRGVRNLTTPLRSSHGQEDPINDRLRFAFGLVGYDPTREVFNLEGIKERLVSYYHIKRHNMDRWKTYERDGIYHA